MKISGPGVGASRRRTALLGGLLASVSAAGCDDGPVEALDPRPRLSNFTYTVEALNVPECPPNGLVNGTQLRWTIEFSDPDGDVVPPVLMEWSTAFNPSGTAKSALLLIPAAAVTGDGSSGQISQTQCVRFGEQESVDITLSIYDQLGHASNPRTLRVERPEGAL